MLFGEGKICSDGFLAGTIRTPHHSLEERKKGDLKNLIIPEEELLEALTDALGAEWNGAENVDEKTFKNLKTVKIYEDGRIEIEMCADQKTA